MRTPGTSLTSGTVPIRESSRPITVTSDLTDKGNGIYLATINLDKILSDSDVQKLGKELQDKVVDLRTKQAKAFIISFEGVKYLTSAALAKFITLKRRLNQIAQMTDIGINLFICDLKPETLDVFKIAMLEDYFNGKPGQQLNSETTLKDIIDSL